MMIRVVRADDAPEITKIYNYYVEQTVITFEEQLVNADEITQRIDNVLSAGHFWLVAELAGKVVGYAYSSPWKTRSAYRFSCEISVYLTNEVKGRGLGTQLLEDLFSLLEKTDINAVIGGITLPNDASVALHEKFGMTKVAHFENVGYKFGQWLDVGYWQKNLKNHV